MQDGKLFCILRFKHFSPKDSKQGILEFIIGKTREEILEYINEEYLYGEYGEQIVYGQIDESLKEKAELIGIEVDEFLAIKGTKEQFIRLFCNTFWEHPEDCYYGVTKYDWSEITHIEELEIETLKKFITLKNL